ncbi:protein Shroom3-like, partial [Scleropages formosus]
WVKQGAMDLLGAFYRRKFRRKQKSLDVDEGALCRSPSESSVNNLANGLISKVLRFTARRSEPVSRPHSWHSAKLGEGQQDPSMMQISQGGMGAPWHQNCQSSASTTDLSSYDPGYLRKSPDQYSSRGSMESLDHGHPAYSSCHQLSSSKSSNSIDHLHNKRDSAYSSFSTSSSIPEYPTAGPSFTKERSYSMESMLSHRGPEGMRQADIRYVRTVYDPQQGISQEHEVSSAKLLQNTEARTKTEGRGGGPGELTTRSNSTGGSSCNSMTNHNSVGSTWGQASSRSSYENLKGAPAPPLRSDSYAAIKNHERPNSWSSLEQARSLRALQKGSWTHSSGSVNSAKSSFTAEGQLHTVMEKSPESSPTIRPKQNFPQAPQPGRLMLPTGIYPVPQPEPHFAQVPTSCPNSGTMYPALAKENMCPSQRDQDREINNTDGLTMEKRNQSNTPSIASQTTGFPKPKTLMHHEGRQEDSNTKFSHYRPHFRPNTEVYGMSQVQNQEPTYRHLEQSVAQERRDPYTRVQQRVDRQRHSQSFENTEVHRQTREEDPVRSIAWTHHLQNTAASSEARDTFNCTQAPYGICKDVSFPTSHGGRGESVHTQKNAAATQLRHYSETDALHQQSDHPLTRLENALVQVQRSNSEDPPSQCSLQTESNEMDAMHLSVLEKVNRFEQQRRSQSQNDMHRSYASRSSTRPSQAPSTKNPYSCMEDSHSKGEVNTSSTTKAWSLSRTQSCTTEGKGMGGLEDNKEFQQYPTAFQMCGNREAPLKNPHCKFMPIQRSKSTYQLGGENGKDFHWKEDLEDILGTIQDSSFNRAYRDSIKDAQTKVLRSTSFRRKDLSANPSVPSKHLSLERKAPKTSPKPVMTSPHTPKERHIVTPEADKSIPPPLPSVPPVGLAVTRIGGRKRLTLEQKKRSYSEPEKMHELGLSDGEDSQKKVSQQFFFPETSVADRRKLFEMAATKSTGPSLSISRPELKQLQQDALAEYMERKTGRRAAGRSRPASAYMQPSSSDSQSISSASSFASLQEPSLPCTPQSDSYPKTNRLSSTLPSGLKGTFYPNEKPTHLYSHSNSASLPKQQETPQELFGSQREISRSSPATSSEYLQSKLPLLHQDRSFQRIVPARSSGKSASAEDLLEHSVEPKLIPQHFRSRSSPSDEKFNKTADVDHSIFEMFSKESLLSYTGNRRLVRNPDQDRPTGTAVRMEKYMSIQGTSQLNPPVIRKEKQRQVERQRAHSAVGLAASVGLPCSFSPPPSSTELDWQASERLCQANMDALARNSFPFRAQAQSAPEGVTPQSSTDTSTTEDTEKEVQWEGYASQVPITTKTMSIPWDKGQEDDHSAPCLSLASQGSLSQTESPSPTQPQHLPSLRISESNLHFSLPAQLSKDDDDVFLEDPAPPTPPPPLTPPCAPLRETELIDFPPPPPPTPPTENEQGVNNLSETIFDSTAAKQLQSLPALPVASDLPCTSVTPSLSAESDVQSPPGPTKDVEYGTVCEDQKGLEEEVVLCRRERSAEELRVEALSRELVSRDKSLTPILGTWAVKTTVDLMEDIFPTGALLPQQQRRSTQLEDRSPGGISTEEDVPLQSQNREMETDLDEEETDLNLKKAELVEALTLSMTALKEEREALAEEQKKFSELGNHIEALVQECCKPNECDKYRMFVGDLDKIVNLLLSLCGRLARVENALTTLDGLDSEDSTKERESLQQKRNQLCCQHEDARELKENLDRRERVVREILAGYLSVQQLRDYQHFVRMKPALLIRQRCLDDLIRQCEEQLQQLGEIFLAEARDLPGGPIPAAPSSSARSTTVTSL